MSFFAGIPRESKGNGLSSDEQNCKKIIMDFTYKYSQLLKSYDFCNFM